MGQIFDVPRTGEQNSSPRNHGATWSKDQIYNLSSLYACGASLDIMCQELGRTRAEILPKLIATGKIFFEYGFYFHCDPGTPAARYEPPSLQPDSFGPGNWQDYKSTTNLTKETMTHANIETKTFIAGQDASAMTDMQIFKFISKLEFDMASLSGIDNKPEKLKAHIKLMADDIMTLCLYVDNRDQPADAGTHL